jgi:hypothetical protein
MDSQPTKEAHKVYRVALVLVALILGFPVTAEEPRSSGEASLTRQPDAEVVAREELENHLMWVSHTNRAYRNSLHRVTRFLFERQEDHWLDANCALEENRWGCTNEWIAGQLVFELVKALLLWGWDRPSDGVREQFVSQWQDGDRLFTYRTPSRVRSCEHGGFLIIRDCRVVGRYQVFAGGIPLGVEP